MHRHTQHHDAVDQAFDTLLQESLNEYLLKQQAFAGAIASYSAWEIDEDAATLRMTGNDGQSVCFQLTPVGTYIPDAKNFAWAWANESFPEASRERASQIKKLTTITGYRVFENEHIFAEPTEIEELCALALWALSGSAIFKVKSDVPWVFYVVK